MSNNLSIFRIKDCLDIEENLIGGKASSLSFLMEKKLNVPEGFVLSSELFKRHIEGILPQDWHDLKHIPEYVKNSEKIIKEILIKEIPFSARIGIEAQMGIIEAPYGFSIRSSAPGEDSHNISMAGVYSSFVSINNFKDIVLNIKKVWASIFTVKSLKILKVLKIKKIPSMAVIIQKMIYPDVSGVCFTANIHNGNTTEMVINSGKGMCSGIVNGISDCDNHIIYHHEDEIDLLDKIIDKKRVFINGDNDICEFSEENALLSNKKILELGEEFLKIEKYKLKPQDIEWGISEEKLYIFQSRDIINNFIHYIPDTEKKYALINSEIPRKPLCPLYLDILWFAANKYISRYSDEMLELIYISYVPYLSMKKGDFKTGIKEILNHKLVDENENSIISRIKSNFDRLLTKNSYKSLINRKFVEYADIYNSEKIQLIDIKEHIHHLFDFMKILENEDYKIPETDNPKVSILDKAFREIIDEIKLFGNNHKISMDFLKFMSLEEIYEKDIELTDRKKMRMIKFNFYSNLKEYPEYINSKEPFCFFKGRDNSIIKGKGISGKTVKGEVVLYRKDMEIKGDDLILVSDRSYVHCSEYFERISGFITGDNNNLSHAVVMAKELGIPTVTNVHNITELVKDGDKIILDGETGCIIIENQISSLGNN